MWWLLILSCRTAEKLDGDNDGVSLPDGDCDEQQPLVYPGAEEVCDGLDNDCDGEVDEDVGDMWYLDSDGDYFGDAEQGIRSCFVLEGYSPYGEDCDDSRTDVHPLAFETCDDIDNDCNGIVDDIVDGITFFIDSDGDGFGNAMGSIQACQVPEGYAENAADCDDSDAGISPAQPDPCNDGLDTNCDGLDNGENCPFSLEQLGLIFHNKEDSDLGGMGIPIGDLNKDGFEDILMGTIAPVARSSDRAESYVFYGPIDNGEFTAADADITIFAPLDSAPYWGRSADFNQDGELDLVFTMRLGDEGGTDAGQLFLLYGPFSEEVSLLDADAAWYGEDPDDQIGNVFDVVDDHQGGFALLIGSGTAGPNEDCNGVTYLISDFVNDGPISTSPDASFQGGSRDFLGYNVRNLGDLNGDGLGEFYINAYRHESESGLANVGSSFIFQHYPTSAETVYDADLRIDGALEIGQMGVVGENIGDVNGDGYNDLLLGSHFYSLDDGFENYGVAFLFSGQEEGYLTTDDAFASFYGEPPAYAFSRRAAGIGDVNEDGFDDIAISAKHDGRNGYRSGAVFFFWGPFVGAIPANHANAIYVGEDTEGRAGLNMNAIGDINAAGQIDLLVGAGFMQNDQLISKQYTILMEDINW